MSPLDFEVWGYYAPGKFSLDHIASLDYLATRLELVDYYYNYVRLRSRIANLEDELAAANGKIYALQETIDGRG